VVSAETVSCFFKTRLDRFWLNQDIIYIIFVLKFTEPEAEVYNYSKIFIRVGIVVLLSRAKRLLPAPVSFLRLHLHPNGILYQAVIKHNKSVFV